ncbi:MAG: nuclear transport factor 2 family protein [bacterium]|nr:hypothetical protein [Deltaproteobacteria bacterium]MCP4905898.1 nuclear transport factor 2 family protein [bacterium]
MTKDYEAIRRLIAIYAQLLDSERREEWGQLFTEDAVFRVAGETFEGRAAIEAGIFSMREEKPAQHVLLSPVIDFDKASSARCWTDMAAHLTTESGIEVVTIARYYDRLVRSSSDGRWRYAQRTLVMGGEDLPPDIEPTPGF